MPQNPPVEDGRRQAMPIASPVLPVMPGIIPTPPDDTVIHDSSLQDSDNLLEWLMTGFNETPFVPLPLSDVSALTNQVTFASSSRSLGDLGSTAGNHKAEAAGIQQLFKLIDDMSKRLSSDIYDKGITSDFLDSCLYEFFQRVLPSFPVIHEPTFSSQKCIPPLLLNMVALGSLHVCLPNAVHKGELLWRLGHTAVATSWQTLISLRGPHDDCDGVQLVLTALLGQTYALLSSNADIRTTAFVFHGLGFYWARTCGMYSISERQQQPPIPNIEAFELEKKFLWEAWAASEVQRRAVLGHYILDGLISQASGSPASARHLINKIEITCPDAAFGAPSADTWILAMSQSNNAVQMPVRMSDVYNHVFDGSQQNALALLKLPSFSVSVVIEGLQSLISEANEVDDDRCFGVVTRQQITQGLLNLYKANILPSFTSDNNKRYSDIVIRWHTVCMEVAAPSTRLYKAICDKYHVPQELGGISTAKQPVQKFDIEEWMKSADSMRALLHALEIIRLLNDIPLSQAHAPHLPIAIFASVVVVSSVCLLGTNLLLDVPRITDWEDVWGQISNNGHELLRALQTNSTVCSINLINELNSLQLAGKIIASRWGISSQMEKITSHLTILAHERLHGLSTFH